MPKSKPELSPTALREWLDSLGDADGPDTRDAILSAIKERTRKAHAAGDPCLLFDADGVAGEVGASSSHARKCLFALHSEKKIGRIWTQRRYRYYAE